MEGGVNGFVPQANRIVGILAGDLNFVTLMHFFTMFEGVQKRLLGKLILLHFVEGVTGENQLALTWLTPAEDLSYHVNQEMLKCLSHKFPFFSSDHKRAEFACQGRPQGAEGEP